jgi:hypothetical protein
MHRDVLGEGKKPREVYPERVAAERNGGPPPFPAVRAGAEADHPDRRHRDDACSPERIRPEGQRAVTAKPVIASEAKQSMTARRDSLDCFIAAAPRIRC